MSALPQQRRDEEAVAEGRHQHHACVLHPLIAGGRPLSPPLHRIWSAASFAVGRAARVSASLASLSGPGLGLLFCVSAMLRLGGWAAGAASEQAGFSAMRIKKRLVVSKAPPWPWPMANARRRWEASMGERTEAGTGSGCEGRGGAGSRSERACCSWLVLAEVESNPRGMRLRCRGCHRRVWHAGLPRTPPHSLLPRLPGNLTG